MVGSEGMESGSPGVVELAVELPPFDGAVSGTVLIDDVVDTGCDEEADPDVVVDGIAAVVATVSPSSPHAAAVNSSPTATVHTALPLATVEASHTDETRHRPAGMRAER